MRVVLQRVRQAEVEVAGASVGAIGAGLVALVGIGRADDAGLARRLAAKTAALRLFPDGERPFALSLRDVGGELLCISQFTLLADARRGNRPSWAAAAPAEVARELVAAYAEAVAAVGIRVAGGEFGADMLVRLANDGPVTIVLDSDDLARPRSAGGGAAILL